jgi:hypothetical protein
VVLAAPHLFGAAEAAVPGFTHEGIEEPDEEPDSGGEYGEEEMQNVVDAAAVECDLFLTLVAPAGGDVAGHGGCAPYWVTHDDIRRAGSVACQMW